MFCIRASVLTAVLMPCLVESLMIGIDVVADFIQLASRESMIGRKMHRVKPESTGLVLASDVDMNRLVAVKAVKVEPIGPGNIFDSRHGIV
jgi:hypothetical protein